MHRSSKAVGVLFTLGVLVLLAGVALYWINIQLGPKTHAVTKPSLVTVASRASVHSVADLLAGRRLVRSRYSVLIAALLDGDAGKLKPGVYAVSPAQTPQQILGMMSAGRTAKVRVTFPEGFTLRQDAHRLERYHLANASEFMRIATSRARSFHTDDGFTPPGKSLEGYLFPDTYDFTPGEPARSIMQDMLNRFDEVVVKPNSSVQDWSKPVILGSLIEREAEISKDRPLIAAVLLNRLRIGMPLQVDATVEYALPAHKSRLLFRDLKTPSSYNTYLHRGLPPGAICNPGLPSIEAALHPAPVDYLYYVAGPGKAHIFSRTLAEQDHNIALVRSGQTPL